PMPPGATATAEAGGIELTLTVGAGPYFVGELVTVTLTVANRSPQAASLSRDCKDRALFAEQRGGRAPTVEQPPGDGWVSCPGLPAAPLAPGATRREDDLVVLGASGELTLVGTVRLRVVQRDSQAGAEQVTRA